MSGPVCRTYEILLPKSAGRERRRQNADFCTGSVVLMEDLSRRLSDVGRFGRHAQGLSADHAAEQRERIWTGLPDGCEVAGADGELISRLDR